MAEINELNLVLQIIQTVSSLIIFGLITWFSKFIKNVNNDFKSKKLLKNEFIKLKKEVKYIYPTITNLNPISVKINYNEQINKNLEKRIEKYINGLNSIKLYERYINILHDCKDFNYKLIAINKSKNERDYCFKILDSFINNPLPYEDEVLSKNLKAYVHLRETLSSHQIGEIEYLSLINRIYLITSNILFNKTFQILLNQNQDDLETKEFLVKTFKILNENKKELNGELYLTFREEKEKILKKIDKLI